jgi:hypothetical protein
MTSQMLSMIDDDSLEDVAGGGISLGFKIDGLGGWDVGFDEKKGTTFSVDILGNRSFINIPLTGSLNWKL